MAAHKPIPARRPTPRREPEHPSVGAVLLLAIVLFCALAGAVWVCKDMHIPTEAERREEAHAIKHDSLAPTYTHDGEVIRWYVLVDPDTSIQYLVNDRGGCCPRLDRYGNVMGRTVEEGYYG